MVNIKLETNQDSFQPIAQSPAPRMRTEERSFHRPNEDSPKKKSKVLKALMRIFWTILILAIVIGGLWFYNKQQSGKSSFVDTSKYQAVFLSNGQTYFGKVSDENESYVTLSEVFYMVVNKPLQDQEQTTAADQAKPEYTLMKLGKELHGPTSMNINRDHILFIENLSDDSKVVSAIKQGK